MLLSQVFDKHLIKIVLESEDKDEVFEELIEEIVRVHPEINRMEALEVIRVREKKMSTGIMRGVAVPHGVYPALTSTVGVVGVSRQGIDYDALDKAPVHLVFLLLTSSKDHQSQVSVMGRLSQVLSSPNFFSAIMEQTTSQGVYDTLCYFESLFRE
jgi:PTS system fructose-specific IIC component/PTS system nitrogen regulatory IIA component